MKRRPKLWLSTILILALGATGCMTSSKRIPELGPAFVDKARDEAGSIQRLSEFDVVCVAPGRKDPPEPPMAPGWCAWTMQADKVIRANNVKARD